MIERRAAASVKNTKRRKRNNKKRTQVTPEEDETRHLQTKRPEVTSSRHLWLVNNGVRTRSAPISTHSYLSTYQVSVCILFSVISFLFLVSWEMSLFLKGAFIIIAVSSLCMYLCSVGCGLYVFFRMVFVYKAIIS